MKIRALMVPCLAIAAIGLAGCDDSDGTGIVTTNTANVRFVNALSGSDENLLLTANGSAVGSTQAFGTMSTTCSSLQAGSGRTLAFGTANSGGTAISSNFGTMTADLLSGGDYTVIATGTSSSPTLLVLNNRATNTATTGNANVRFVNATGSAVDFFATPGATLGTATSSNIGANASSSFAMVPTANSTLTFTSTGSTTPLFTTSGSFMSGRDYTIVLLPNAAGNGFQTLTLSGC